MFKSLVAIAAFVFMGFAAAPASAQDFYGKVSVGQTAETSAGNINFSDGAAFGVALGTSVRGVRVEVGADRLNASVGSLNGHANDYSATVFLDVPVTQNAALYAGIGGDWANSNAGNGFFDINGSGWGYHYLAGASYRISERVTAEAQVRVLNVNQTYDFIGDTNVVIGSATVGVRFAL